jgi:hypothetical protein
VVTWLAAPARARFHLHFIPTSSSWLNLVERWFREPTTKRLRRGVFRSVPDLVGVIYAYIALTTPTPGHWPGRPPSRRSWRRSAVVETFLRRRTGSRLRHRGHERCDVRTLGMHSS